MTKPRKLLRETQVRLIVREARHRDVRALHAQNLCSLRRDRFVPMQFLADDHRLACEDDRRRVEVDRVINSADTIAVAVERIFSAPPVYGLTSRTRRNEQP